MSLSPEQVEYFKEHASDNLGPSLIAAYSAGLVIAYIFVGLRIWARKVSKVRFSYDDWLIIAALVPLTAYAIGGFIAVSYGEGKHIIFVTNPAGFIEVIVAAITAYAICGALTKISILCFYCRIFFPIRSLVYISWVFGVIIVAYNLATILSAALQCIPLSATWTGTGGRCYDMTRPLTGLSVLNMVVDMCILALPIRYVIPRALTVAQRVQVCGVFLTGGVVCVFGVLRVVAHVRTHSGDPSYNQVGAGIWSLCEIAVGIVAACLPTLAVLFVKWHLSKQLTSAIYLLASPFRRSRSSHRSDSEAIECSFRQSLSNDNQYTNISNQSLPGDNIGDRSNLTY